MPVTVITPWFRCLGRKVPYAMSRVDGRSKFSSSSTVVADRLDTGMVWINSPQGWAADLPFGGTKRSGVGRELGPLGIDEFVNKKLVYTPAG